MVFDWDDSKHERNFRERGYGFDYASLIFEGRTIDWEDTRFNYGEKRVVAVGRVEDRFLTVVYTDRNEVRWIIASWPSSRKKRRLWLE